jgi:hypothetical protein
MLGNYRVAAQLVASRAVLSSTELVSFSAYKRAEWWSDLVTAVSHINSRCVRCQYAVVRFPLWLNTLYSPKAPLRCYF